MVTRLAASLIALLVPLGASAHPHVFVDATVEVIFDSQNRATALRIGWTYDDLFSLSYLTEMGFDPDFDGALTPEETARLAGFDAKWDPDFDGDSYALLGVQPVGLSRPQEPTVAYQGGKLITSHLRQLAEPVDLMAGAELVVQIYDPSFYTSYVIGPDPVLTGAKGCTAQVFEPDRAAADARLEAALQEYAGAQDAETEFPAIGSAYAEEVRVTCAP